MLLIQDAFISLLREKNFEAITVKDIAERATVNRATFYAHFVDKFEILESKIITSFTTILARRINGCEGFNEESVQNIFLTKDKILSPNEQAVMNTASIILSWRMYGAAYDWNLKGRRHISAESFVKQSMPWVLDGVRTFIKMP